MYIHVYIVKEGKSPDPADKASKLYSKKFTVYRSKRMCASVGVCVCACVHACVCACLHVCVNMLNRKAGKV